MGPKKSFEELNLQGNSIKEVGKYEVGNFEVSHLGKFKSDYGYGEHTVSFNQTYSIVRVLFAHGPNTNPGKQGIRIDKHSGSIQFC